MGAERGPCASGDDGVDRTQPFPSQLGASVRYVCPELMDLLSATPQGRSGAPLPWVLLSALPGSHGQKGLRTLSWYILIAHVGGKCVSCVASQSLMAQRPP